MRSHLLIGSTLAATLAVAALGLADPQGAKGGGSVGVSLGGSAATPSASGGARPATSASVGFSASGGVAPPAGSAAVSTRGDARGKATGPAAALARGHGAYMARDYPGAIAAYKEAIAQDGSDPSSYYFLGEAQIAGGNTAEADASFAAGLRNVANKDDWHGKLLFVVADLRERQGKWPEAKKAWEEYAQFLSTHPAVKGYQATATERVKVIDAHVDLDAKYAPVRQRIEQRVKENAAPPQAADETPPPPSAPAKKK